MKATTYNVRALVVSLLLAILSLSPVFALSSTQEKLPPPAGHVNDFAEVLETANRQRLETILENLKTRTELDLVIAIVKSAGSEELYDYSRRVASDWGIGTRTSPRQSLLLVIAADNGRFFAQFSRAAQVMLPDGLIGEMGRRMQPRFDAHDYNGGLLTGVQSFVNGVGDLHNFTFAQLDPQSGETTVAQTRPRTVERTPTPSDTPTPTPVPEETPLRIVASPTPSETPAPPAVTPTPEPSESPTPETTPSATPSATPAESVTPASTPETTPVVVESPTPASTIRETPAVESTPTPGASPLAEGSPAPEASPSSTSEVARTVTRPPRSARASMTRSDPEAEKEEVELTLTKPVAERIDLLKTFIADHPKSVAVPRAQELIVSAHATLGDQKLAAGDIAGGLEQFKLALSEAPADMTDRLFTEVITRIPMNLFLRGQRDAAIEAARQAERLAKLNPVRLLAVTQFYLGIEDVAEANRLAELTVANAPEVAAAHQVLGAARHIALRLDDAEAEYAKALALNPKLTSAKIALADLKRASGKNEEALTLYREVAEADAKNNAARAGIVLSLLELNRKDEAEQALTAALQDAEKARSLPLLVGAAYWFMAHGDATRGLELAQRAVVIEPRYSWGEIAFARALVADKRPADAERALRFARTYGHFPTLDYELASVLAALGLYDEAVAELSKTFSLNDGQIETKLAGRVPARAATFTELLAPERRAAIFQNTPADSEASAKMLKGLLAFNAALNGGRRAPSDDELVTIAQDFISSGDEAMRTYRQIYVASKLLKQGVALASVVDLMDSATTGVEAALNAPAATVAVQAEELAEARARALAQGGTPEVPNAPRAALSGLIRARIEDIAGMALLNLDKPAEAVARLRRAVSVAPQGTPLWRSTMWHLGTALEAEGKHDQALLYYIKSYLAGAADPARRSVIENVYKKVNGTLDGLDDKIGPPFSSTPAAKPSPTPNEK